MRQRSATGIVTVLYFAAFALMMYALWNAVGSEKMDNWQGRYFMAIAPVVVLTMAMGPLEKWKSIIDIASVLVLMASNLVMAVCIWERYWV